MEKDQFLFGVNAGGSAYTDIFGHLYVADTFGAGKKYKKTIPISGTTDDLLYQSETWNAGGFTYNISLAAGFYYVELNFAEIREPNFSPGSRIFDIYLEGTLVLDDLDITAAAGGATTAYTVGYFVNVTDGALTLTTTSEVDNPKISAFSIWSVSDGSGGDTIAPKAVISVTEGSSASNPATVTVVYSDETALNPSTITLGDLTISTNGPTVGIQSQSLVFAPDGLSATATYTVIPQGGWTSDPVTFTVAANAFADASGNTNAAEQTTYSFDDPFSGIAPVDPVDPNLTGKVRISVTANGNVQASTFGTSAFKIENLGDKRIAAVLFDITDAVFQDSVFDPVGLAGDSVSRGLLFGSTGNTGAVVVGSAKNDPDVLVPFYGTGGSSGYERMLVRFDPNVSGGFQINEVTTFGVDIDPNSIIGIPQQPLDINGQDPRLNSWDIGGVSGAELIGSTITILFTDGTKATAQLMGNGTQGGAIALADQGSTRPEVDLVVNGVPEGGSGIYDGTDSVIITGPAGQTARIVMAIGFAQPFDYIDANGNPISTADRLAAAGDRFGANNALEIQTVNVVLTGAPQDITHLFDFNAPGGTLSFPGDNLLPVAFTAAVVNSAGEAVGPVTAPIYLEKDGAPPPPSTSPTVEISFGDAPQGPNDPLLVRVVYADDEGLNPATVSLNDLNISTNGPAINVQWQNLQFTPDGMVAAATYSVLPQGGWTGSPVSFSVAAGAIADNEANPNPAVQESFTFDGAPAAGANSLAEMTQLTLQGVSLNNPTSIDVGSDGRLYVSQQDGLIVALTIQKTVSVDAQGVKTVTWSVTDRENITAVQTMPNHDDVGIYQPTIAGRQVTGVVTTVDANGNVMLYVSSSDPRIGGGGSGTDTNLDTNSGIISRLTQVDDGSGNLVWQKVDLVRGLPRSEENHSLNGMQLVTDAFGNERLLVTVGGNTNIGAPSFNFAYQPEYYYSASVISIDLAALAELEATQGLKTYAPSGAPAQKYLYDLPTLDDPTRSNTANGDLAGNGSTTADVFGGNDGLNQAIFDPNGYVTVYATGFRNAYDLVVTQSGAVYTVDNGSNQGWGGRTVNASGQVLTDSNGDGLADNGPGLNLESETGQQSNADSLLRIDSNFYVPDGQVYYGGHPDLFRAYGSDAGLYLYANPGNPWGVAAGTPLTIVNGALQPAAAPVDLMQFISNASQLTGTDASGNPLIDPRQALVVAVGQRAQGLTDAPNGALYTWFSSTNGLDEYTASGGLKNSLIAVSFDGKIYAIDLDANGNFVGVESRGLTSSPLDLVTQGDGDPYPGVIFISAYGADQIVILAPEESVGDIPNPNDRDVDGIDDTIDPFAADPNNGKIDIINPGDVWHWTFVNGVSFPNDDPALFDGTGGLYNGGDVGFTGIMTNRGGLPESLFNQQNIIFGGAPGVLQVKEVEIGDPTTDTQRNGFQFGVTAGNGLESFTVTSLIDNYLDEIAAIPASEKLSQGIFIGAGDQNNFVSVALARLADGRAGFEVVSQFAFAFIGATAPVISFYEVPALAVAGSLDTMTLGLDVNVTDGTVIPTWTYSLGGTATSGSGAAVALQGDALAALRGTLTLPDDSGGQVPVGLAVGVMSSRSGSSGTETIAAFSAGGDESFSTTIDGQQVTFVPDTQASNVTIFGSTKVKAWSETRDIANSALDELYTEERFAGSAEDWGYSIATGNGTFLVDLYFAESFSGVTAPGARVFDVLVEGAVIRDNFDIFAAAGGRNLETVITYEAVVTDGVLDIAFSKEIENAKVDAIHVRGATGSFAADWDDIRIEGFGTPVSDTFVFALNAGGPQYTTASGVTYQADTFGAGKKFTTTKPIAGTDDDVLYQSEIWKAGGFTYEVPVDNGTYRVELNFAEIYSGNFDPGDRVFDVLLEGQLAIDNLDIVTAAGGPVTAYTVSRIVNVTDGALTLATSPEVDNPKISAFSIWAEDSLV